MDKILPLIKEHASMADYWSLYVLEEEQEELQVRFGHQEPINTFVDKGAMITIMKNGGMGYAATQDLSENGIKWAIGKAFSWAQNFKEFSLLNGLNIAFSNNCGFYQSKTLRPVMEVDLEEKLSLLKKADSILKSHKKIVDSESTLWSIDTKSFFFNSLGANIEQKFYKMVPSLSVTAYDAGLSQFRSLGGMRAHCRQGGYEDIINIDLCARAQNIVKEAIDLLKADNCPNLKMDTLIDPDQMMLQIHESIGHPLELDRILGDERNYAGTSFVTVDMFGKYQYGSKLLNISFDPSINGQFASYAFDNEGSKAEKDFIIKNGLLIKPLGAKIAQSRAKIDGVANARSCSWNRPPIDRMANLNLEPGTSTFDEMLNSIERGIYLKSNCSWSIDDSRNKFQFGCEWGQLIENGKLTKVVRNPNYRGLSAQFWKNLKMVGNTSTFQVMGTPFCGKGEPNQSIEVGHASPICLFSDVDVFGGE